MTKYFIFATLLCGILQFGAATPAPASALELEDRAQPAKGENIWTDKRGEDAWRDKRSEDVWTDKRGEDAWRDKRSEDVWIDKRGEDVWTD
ncbi:MAG: hypothetical protein M1822_002070 [Bathelium mastoideum]|nr:MAG: hypothetical protein M1822_002070 [Bathelium mastoideum]